jgi:hypothetical protein
MRGTTLVAVLLLSLLVVGRAEAKHAHFLGPHPIAARYGGGFCYIETPHLHIYPPDHPALYQQVGDEQVFTGDPTPFGYEGDKHPYYGHHPLAIGSGEPVYCYIDGPHFHSAPPPSGDGYKVKDGVAFYVGPFAPAYAKLKPHRARVVNAEYRPYATFRPTVQVQPPPEWHGDVYVAGPGVEVQAPGVEVRAPGVEVQAPGVEVRGPGIEVRGPGVFVEPPHPRLEVRGPAVEVRGPGVFVEAPHPRVDVHVHAGVVVEPPPPRAVVIRPHDHGRHRGWR